MSAGGGGEGEGRRGRGGGGGEDGKRGAERRGGGGRGGGEAGDLLLGAADASHPRLSSVSLLTHLTTYLLQALGSVSVLVSGLVIKFGEAWGPRRFLADPLASLLIVLILLRGAVPLVRQCVRRLLAEPEPEPEPEPESVAPSDCPA